MEGGQATKLIENLSDLRNLVIVSKGIYFVPQQVTALGSSIEFLDFATNHTKRIASFGKLLVMVWRCLRMADGCCIPRSIKLAPS